SDCVLRSRVFARHMCPAARNLAALPPFVREVAALLSELAQIRDERPGAAADCRGEEAARRTFVEGRKRVGEAGHGAADANAPGVHASAIVAERAARDDIALHDGAPAAELDQALLLPVLVGKLALFVVAGPHATVVHRRFEHPSGAAKLIELWQWTDARKKHQHCRDRLGDVVADG